MITFVPHALMFCGGVLIGLVLFPLIKLLDQAMLNQLLDRFTDLVTAPFRWCGRLFRKGAGAYPLQQENVSARAVDPREQQISDSAHAVRAILSSLAKEIQRIDKAASDSSQALDDVRGVVDHMELPVDLKEAHRALMQEIDRVIANNTKLKRELDSSQQILVDQRRQIESLRTAVRIDGLTQLANRAYFDEKLAESLDVLKRYNETFSLMMIDLDNFKEINDGYGHPGGDRILKGVAFKIRELLRSSDFLARFGGDEFALILLKADAGAATDVAWKLCEGVRESRFVLDGVSLSVTLSIGVTEAWTEDTEESLLKRADEALYRVKHTGRNRALLIEKPGENRDGHERTAGRQSA